MSYLDDLREGRARVLKAREDLTENLERAEEITADIKGRLLEVNKMLSELDTMIAETLGSGSPAISGQAAIAPLAAILPTSFTRGATETALMVLAQNKARLWSPKELINRIMHEGFASNSARRSELVRVTLSDLRKSGRIQDVRIDGVLKYAHPDWKPE